MQKLQELRRMHAVRVYSHFRQRGWTRLFCDSCHKKSCKFTDVCEDGYCSKHCHGCSQHPRCKKCRTSFNLCKKGFCEKCCYGCEEHGKKCLSCHVEPEVCKKGYCAKCCRGCSIHFVCVVCKRPHAPENMCSFGEEIIDQKIRCCVKCCKIPSCAVHSQIVQLGREPTQWTFSLLSGDIIFVVPLDKLHIQKNTIIVSIDKAPSEITRARIIDESGLQLKLQVAVSSQWVRTLALKKTDDSSTSSCDLAYSGRSGIGSSCGSTSGRRFKWSFSSGGGCFWDFGSTLLIIEERIVYIRKSTRWRNKPTCSFISSAVWKRCRD